MPAVPGRSRGNRRVRVCLVALLWTCASGSADAADPAAAPAAAPRPAARPVSPATLTPATYADLVQLNPGYRPSHISEATLAALTQHEAPGSTGEMVADEGSTGYRPEIGDRAYAAQIWAITMDPRARGHMLAQADLSKLSWPYHVGIKGQHDAGPPRPWLYSVDRYGNMLFEGRPIVRDADPNDRHGIHYDPAHSPAFVFDAAMLMGIEKNEAKFREYLTEQMWRATFMLMSMSGQYCQGAKGIFNSYMGQQRAAAWALRDLDDLVLLLEQMEPLGLPMTDDDRRWLAWGVRSLNENGAFLNGVFNADAPAYVTDLPAGTPGSFEPYAGRRTGSLKNSFGFTGFSSGGYGGGPDGNAATLAPWQQGFHSRIILRTARRKHRSFTPAQQATWDALARFTGRFPVMVFGAYNDPNALDARFADRYTMVVGRLDTGFFKTVAEYKAANDSGKPVLPPGERVMRQNADPTVPAGFPGSFANDVTPALADAVDLGLPGAAQAWARLNEMEQITQGADLSFSHAPKGYFWPVGPAPHGRAQSSQAPGAAEPAAPASPSSGTAPPASGTPSAATASVGASAVVDRSFDAARATKASDEGGRFALRTVATVWYGAGTSFVSKVLKPGEYVADNRLFGDPAPGTKKAAYVSDRAVLAGRPAKPGKLPARGALPTPADS